MSMIPEVKCRRCGETFSSMRSRCPNCGTRRVTQSSRTPSTTPGTVRGTASYERAETNTKWQLIFGLILVVAVILAVIVMVTTSLEGMDSAQQSNTQITPPIATQYVPEIESAPTPPPTPPPQVEGIRVLYYTTEMKEEFTMRVGEVLDFTAQVMPITLEGAKVTWTSSDENYLKVDVTGDLSATLSCVGDVAGGVKLTVACGTYEKTLNVYCRPAD